VKLMYWSFLVYDYQEEAAGAPSPYNPDTALLLYQLEHWECMWEKSLDTKAIVGWNSDTVGCVGGQVAAVAAARAKQGKGGCEGRSPGSTAGRQCNACDGAWLPCAQVVIAFRGTASLANVKADLQVWRTRWPPGVGNVFMRT
jgi:hypothetical protein